jgi:hypothetical protein
MAGNIPLRHVQYAIPGNNKLSLRIMSDNTKPVSSEDAINDGRNNEQHIGLMARHMCSAGASNVGRAHMDIMQGTKPKGVHGGAAKESTCNEH